MSVEARVCRESGRALEDPNAVFALIDYLTKQVAVIDLVTLHEIPDSSRDFEKPFSPEDVGYGYREEQLGANVFQTVPADQRGIVLPDDFMFAMWPRDVMQSLPNIAIIFGYPKRDLSPNT